MSEDFLIVFNLIGLTVFTLIGVGVCCLLDKYCEFGVVVVFFFVLLWAGVMATLTIWKPELGVAVYTTYTSWGLNK